ncbi:hypothetical protein ACXYTP_20225 [Tsukamurella ocularis]|uniref:hypothetical protein n=1 Tax=Tsukamurella ocularis TaxID=1970234 RepID=UPI0039EEBAB8
MGFESQRKRFAVFGLLAIPMLIAAVAAYLVIHLVVFGACLIAIDAVLSRVFANAAFTYSGWWTVSVIALAIATTVALGRGYDRAVIARRRRRGADVDGLHATTLRRDLGRLLTGGVDWWGFLRFLVATVPAVVTAIYVMKHTVAQWFELSPVVTEVLVVVLAFLIAYPILSLQELLLAIHHRRRTDANRDQSR